MRQLMSRLWNDDRGALIAIEWVFVATILVLGVTVGLATVRNAVNSELTEVANAFTSLNQSYSFVGESNVCRDHVKASVAGSAAFDRCDSQQITHDRRTRPCPVNDDPCN